jgi:hypothetical protein
MHSSCYDNSIIPDRDEAATAVRRPVGWDRAEALRDPAKKRPNPQTEGLGLRCRSGGPAEDSLRMLLASIASSVGRLACDRAYAGETPACA